MTRLAVTVTILSILAVEDIVAAAEQPISGTRLLLRRSTSGKEKLAFVSKDPSFLFPTIGGPDDPSPFGSGGLVVELFAPSTPAGVALDAPGGIGTPGWSVRTSTPPRLQYRNPSAPASPSTFRSITLRAGKVVKLTGRESGLDLSAPLGSVGIRITTGSLVSCARFGPATVQKDSGGTFSARNAVASALVDCSDASLASGASTTTSTSTVTSTTAAPVCGDDVVNQASEQCDGTDRSLCEGFDCGPPGYSTACQCCGNTQVPTFPVALPCCDPAAQMVFAPSVALCVSTDCSGPFTCTFGSCQNGSCCAGTGTPCGAVGGGGSSASVPCCDPAAVCGFPHNSFPTAFCCSVPGGACGADSDCCASTCVGNTCSCVPSGGQCFSNAHCCSGTCNAGTCSP